MSLQVIKVLQKPSKCLINMSDKKVLVHCLITSNHIKMSYINVSLEFFIEMSKSVKQGKEHQRTPKNVKECQRTSKNVKERERT